MTRVNLIPVKELPDKMLLAEHREIKRIPNCILKDKFNLDNVPYHYTMGKGHVKFFYPRLKFLFERYVKIYNECIKRGFNVVNYSKCFLDAANKYKSLCDNEYYNWQPSKADLELSQQRINEKLNMKPSYYRWSNCIEETQEDKFYQRKADMAFDEYRGEKE